MKVFFSLGRKNRVSQQNPWSGRCNPPRSARQSLDNGWSESIPSGDFRHSKRYTRLRSQGTRKDLTLVLSGDSNLQRTSRDVHALKFADVFLQQIYQSPREVGNKVDTIQAKPLERFCEWPAMRRLTVSTDLGCFYNLSRQKRCVNNLLHSSRQ